MKHRSAPLEPEEPDGAAEAAHKSGKESRAPSAELQDDQAAGGLLGQEVVSFASWLVKAGVQ